MPKPRLTLPRAYLRMSPNLDQHPDPEGMVLLLCAANRQPERGRFRDKPTLVRALGASRLKRFLARGDVVETPAGWYVEGWDEWQEGDLTVGERQARIRDRKRDSAVTLPLPGRDGVTAEGANEDHGVPSLGRDSAVTLPLLDRAAPSEAVDVSTHVERRYTERSAERSSRARSRDVAGLTHLTDSVSTAWTAAAGVTLAGSGDYAAGYIDDACRRHPEADVVTAIATARAGFAFVPAPQPLAVAVRNQLDPLPAGGKAGKSKPGYAHSAEEVEAAFNR